MILVVMGVAGAGKTTVGRAVATALGVPFLDADAFHPPANVAKMAAGSPLDDADRAPWLRALAEALAAAERAGGAVLACSALKESYRLTLAAGLQRPPRWVHLSAPREVLAARLSRRQGHFMPAALLDSQLDTLEPPGDALPIDATRPPRAICAEILAALRAAR
ncbi:MAG TPA: gluconokinase [Polyangiaceae bacterium]|nr:gluconokinase [Polyangiaceae bacterium]